MARGEAHQAPSLAESFGQPMTVGEGRIHFLQDHGCSKFPMPVRWPSTVHIWVALIGFIQLHEIKRKRFKVGRGPREVGR